MELTKDTLQYDIAEAIPRLLDIARESTWNKISDNCKFILTEISNDVENAHQRRVRNKKENDKKTPLSLAELMPTLQKLYDNIYDINLHIYRSRPGMTVIDIRYYLKSSLDDEYRQKVLYNEPMLHCKVSMPPWLGDKWEKFNVNWEHKLWLINLRLALMGLRLRFKRY